MGKKVLVNEQVCMGCRLCEVYCRLAHSTKTDIVKAFRRENNLPRVKVESGNPVFFSLRCQHCMDAPCLSACLTGSLSRDEKTGAIINDEDRCTGCWTCILACPYGAVKQDVLQHKTVRCDLCSGREMPACVVHCPNDALVYTEIPEATAR